MPARATTRGKTPSPWIGGRTMRGVSPVTKALGDMPPPPQVGKLPRGWQVAGRFPPKWGKTGPTPASTMDRSKMLRRARAEWMIIAALKGATHDDIGEALNLTDRQVGKELAWAAKEGLIERVRDRMRETLMHAPDVHAEVLNADPEHLHKHSRGYQLKLQAFSDLAKGVGAFRTETVATTKSLSLSAVAGDLVPLIEGEMDAAPTPRVLYSPDDVRDGEVLPEESEPSA